MITIDGLSGPSGVNGCAGTSIRLWERHKLLGVHVEVEGLIACFNEASRFVAAKPHPISILWTVLLGVPRTKPWHTGQDPAWIVASWCCWQRSLHHGTLDLLSTGSHGRSQSLRLQCSRRLGCLRLLQRPRRCLQKTRRHCQAQGLRCGDLLLQLVLRGWWRWR